jgi:hypothetical protein
VQDQSIKIDLGLEVPEECLVDKVEHLCKEENLYLKVLVTCLEILFQEETNL